MKGPRFNRDKAPLIDAMLTAALDAREDDPYFRNPGEDGIWRWHASKLAQCPRQQVLERAGIAPDPTPLNGRMTMHLGTWFHGVAEHGASILADTEGLELIGTELGGFHPHIPLAARSDLVLGDRSAAIILEIKTEGHYSFTGRRKVAREGGFASACRPEHILQVHAQAVTLEDLGVVEHVDGAIIVYCDRDNGERDQQTVTMGDLGRTQVRRRVAELEATWALYESTEVLPAQLPNMEKCWQCKPIDESEQGKYCRSRSACVALAALGR